MTECTEQAPNSILTLHFGLLHTKELKMCGETKTVFALSVQIKQLNPKGHNHVQQQAYTEEISTYCKIHTEQGKGNDLQGHVDSQRLNTHEVGARHVTVVI